MPFFQIEFFTVRLGYASAKEFDKWVDVKKMTGNQKRASEGKEQVYQTGLEVAEEIIKIVKTEKPPLRVRTSKWAEKICELKTKADPDGTKIVAQIKENFL